MSQIHVFFDKISLTKIKTRKSFKKGSENSQIYQGKPTNTWQIKFLMDWSLKVHLVVQKKVSNRNLLQIWRRKWCDYLWKVSRQIYQKLYLWSICEFYYTVFVSFHFPFWSFLLFWFLSKKSCQRKLEFVTNIAVFLYD